MYRRGDVLKSESRVPELDGGKHHRARLGFILMSTDMAAENDIYRLIPEGVAAHITRLKTEDYTTNETLARHIDGMADAAARLQPEARPDIVCYSCTSGSIVNGEERVMQEIAKGAPYAQPMTLVTGVVDALHELNAQKIVVCTPYLDEINTLEAEFLLDKGFDLLDIQGLNLEDGLTFGKVTPAYWETFALSVDQSEADAIFISCGGIRSVDAIEAIEQAAGKPVVTSNQAMLWSCLRRAGIEDQLSGFGRLFSLPGKSLPRVDRL